MTLPGSQTRDLSLRSTSVHMVSSDSSLFELSSVRICSASLDGSPPRAIVPEIGHVSTRSPLTRTNISGEAPTRYSPSPRLKRNPYGAGFPCGAVEQAAGRVARAAEHLAGHHLEQVPAREPLLGLPHDLREGARYRARAEVPSARDPPASPQRNRRVAGHPDRRRRLSRAAAPRCWSPRPRTRSGRPWPIRACVQREQLVGEVQDQVTLVPGAVAAEPDRLELEGQVVAERTVQAEVRAVARERGGHLAQRGEHGGAPAPVFLGDQPGQLGDDHLDRVRPARSRPA